MTMIARGLFFALGALGAATLAVQFSLNLHKEGDVAGALWVMGGYFTLWTAAFVSFSCLNVAAARQVGPRQAGLVASAALFAAVVGVTYHFVLAPTHHPVGTWAQTNIILHYLLPLGVATLWALATPKGRLGVRGPFLWLAFPLIYFAWVVIRGAASGEYPYFFLDLDRYGPLQVGVNSAVLLAAFVIGGLGLVGLDRLMAGRAGAAEPRS